LAEVDNKFSDDNETIKHEVQGVKAGIMYVYSLPSTISMGFISQFRDGSSNPIPRTRLNAPGVMNKLPEFLQSAYGHIYTAPVRFGFYMFSRSLLKLWLG